MFVMENKKYEHVRQRLLTDLLVEQEYEALNLEYQLIEQLVQIRLAEHLSQDELSKRIGIPKSNISRFEHRKHSPTIETLIRYATGLNKKIVLTISDREE